MEIQSFFWYIMSVEKNKRLRKQTFVAFCLYQQAREFIRAQNLSGPAVQNHAIRKDPALTYE